MEGVDRTVTGENTSQVQMDWATAVQLEQCRATKINSLMQAVSAVPMFDGKPNELEYFLKRMDLVVGQISQAMFDAATNNYVVGYCYSRIVYEVLMEIGASCDTPWEDLKRALREKYSGAARSIPKIVIREVLVHRSTGEPLSEYAKAVWRGFRKVKDRTADQYSVEEAKIRAAMIEEVAIELITCNLPSRLKQWVKMVKPGTIQDLVKVIEDDETDEKEDRWESRKETTHRRQPDYDGWYKVQRRRPNKEPSYKHTTRKIQTGIAKAYNRPRDGNWERPRSRDGYKGLKQACWECKETGHFARECPYIYRRTSRHPQFQFTSKDEPMEVNAMRLRHKGYKSPSDSESESSVVSREGSISSHNRSDRNNQWSSLRKRNEKSRGGKTVEKKNSC